MPSARGSERRQPEQDKGAADQANAPFAYWRKFLDEHDHSDRADHREIHDSAGEEQQHQRPATAKAQESMLDPQSECAPAAVAPAAHQEPDRSTARRETPALERGELIDPRPDQQRS